MDADLSAMEAAMVIKMVKMVEMESPRTRHKSFCFFLFYFFCLICRRGGRMWWRWCAFLIFSLNVFYLLFSVYFRCSGGVMCVTIDEVIAAGAGFSILCFCVVLKFDFFGTMEEIGTSFLTSGFLSIVLGLGHRVFEIGFGSRNRSSKQATSTRHSKSGIAKAAET